MSDRVATAQVANATFWRQLLTSMKAQARLHFHFSLSNFAPADANVRDVAMGNNLVWLAREAYPQRKIIVWAATFHNLRNPALIHPALRDVVTMGHVAWQALGSEIYNIGFTCYGGETGRVKAIPDAVPAPATGSLEDLWASTNHEVAFLDLRAPLEGGEWLRAPFTARLAGHAESLNAEWAQTLDAMVFIRTMRPSTANG
jgi:erythromycin esterase